MYKRQGLDSTLALLVTVRAFDLLNLPREQIHCITMPCFGTTDRTYTNALSLIHICGNLRGRVGSLPSEHFSCYGRSHGDRKLLCQR